MPPSRSLDISVLTVLDLSRKVLKFFSIVLPLRIKPATSPNCMTDSKDIKPVNRAVISTAGHPRSQLWPHVPLWQLISLKFGLSHFLDLSCHSLFISYLGLFKLQYLKLVFLFVDMPCPDNVIAVYPCRAFYCFTNIKMSFTYFWSLANQNNCFSQAQFPVPAFAPYSPGFTAHTDGCVLSCMTKTTNLKQTEASDKSQK